MIEFTKPRHRMRGLFDGATDVRDVLPRATVEFFAFEQSIRVEGDGREGDVDLVGDVAGFARAPVVGFPVLCGVHRDTSGPTTQNTSSLIGLSH
jgi:hypothetical protein